MVAYVIDDYYLVISLLITVGWQCLGFFIAWTLQVGLHYGRPFGRTIY